MREGECLSSVAFEHGFFSQTLWDLPENATLARERGDMNCLSPGDVIVIPDLRSRVVPVATGARHRFRLRTTPVKFKVRLTRSGRPRARVPFRLVVDGRDVEGITDDDGRLEAWVSPLARGGALHVEDDVYPVRFRTLLPVADLRGIQQRLRNMRLYDGEAHGELDDDTRGALRNLQAEAGLPVTGEPDAATQQVIDARHGGER